MTSEKTNQVLNDLISSKKSIIESLSKDIQNYQDNIISLEARKTQIQEELDSLDIDFPTISEKPVLEEKIIPEE